MIDDMKQERMLFENDTFENVTFHEASFVHTILRNNVFLNCRFDHVVFAGGEWVGNRHQGGVMRQVELGNVENPFVWDDSTGPRNTRIDSNVIENVQVSDWCFAAGFANAFTITNLTFRNSRLWNNDMGNAVKVTGQILMDSCEMGEKAWNLMDGVLALRCKALGPDGHAYAQRVEEFKGPYFYGDSVINATATGGSGRDGFRSGVALKYGRNLQIRKVHLAAVGGGEDILIEDVRGDHVELGKRFDHFSPTFRNVTLRRVRVDLLALGSDILSTGMTIRFEDCRFEDLDADVLDLSHAIFVNCHFRNVRIRKKIIGLANMPTFKDCTFDNIHRDAGVLVWSYTDRSGDPPASPRLPWETEEEWQRVQKKPWWKLW
jgi:uncharacterized protein YjbI with pentapeptide repeats